MHGTLLSFSFSRNGLSVVAKREIEREREKE